MLKKYVFSHKEGLGCKVSPLVWSIFIGQNADLTSGLHCTSDNKIMINSSVYYQGRPGEGQHVRGSRSRSAGQEPGEPGRGGQADLVAHRQQSRGIPGAAAAVLSQDQVRCLLELSSF